MIIINLLLDILINNFTSFNSYFFLTNIFNIRYKNCFIIIFVALFIDIYIGHTFLFNIIILLGIYLIDKILLKRKKGFLCNIAINTLNYLIYILSLYVWFNYNNINIICALKLILINYPINVVYYLINYRLILVKN